MTAPPSFDYAGNRAALDGYFAGFVALDAERSVAVMTDDVAISDPTFAVLTGERFKMTGRQAFKDWWAPLTSMAHAVKLELLDVVMAGDFAVARGIIRTVTDGKAAGRPELKTLPIDYKFTTVFEFRSGLISGITSYYDYEATRAQIERA